MKAYVLMQKLQRNKRLSNSNTYRSKDDSINERPKAIGSGGDCGDQESIYSFQGRFSCSVMSDSCNPMDGSPLGSSVHGILQARILERVPFPSPKMAAITQLS